MADETKYPDDLGALWVENGPRGPYMTGTIAGQKVICWPVEKKQGKQPDWRVKRSKPKGEQAQSSGHHQAGPPLTDDEIPW